MRGAKLSYDEEPRALSWNTLKSLVPFLLEYKQRVALALGCLVLAKLGTVGMPFILKHVVDAMDRSLPGNEGMKVLSVPLGLLLAYGSLRFFNVMFAEIRDTLFGRVTERAMHRIGLKVFEHLHHLDLAFHLDRQTGGLSRDIERGVAGISFIMRFMVFNIVPTLLEIAMVIGILLFNYDGAFSLITLVAIVLYIAFSVIATDWRTGYIRAANQADSASNSRAVDSLLNFETVKYFTNENYESQRYDEDLERWEQAKRKNRLSLFALNGGQAFIVAAAMTSMMVLAASKVADGRMTLGDFVLINAFMMQLFMPLNFLGFIYREMKGSMANIERMFALLELKPGVRDADNASDLELKSGEIRFEQVDFQYAPERPILKNVSLHVAPKQKVAVVGASGAGKSTLVKLLFRFYDVSGGRITIDGQDIREVSQQSLRKAIGIVPQDTVLFNASIFDNICYGRVDASKEEVWEAARLAHLEEFIQRLPKGMETRVGERGLKLSGGEKQRVAIARTILKRPPILVFDEATSSLDSRSERSILEAIEEISKGQTSLVIAHRLSTVVDADVIVVMQDGQVVEQGSHRKLLEQQGVYHKLWTIQQQERTPVSELENVAE